MKKSLDSLNYKTIWLKKAIGHRFILRKVKGIQQTTMCQIPVGIHVSIVDGPFDGYHGLVSSVDGTRVVVEVYFLGRPTLVTLYPEQLELANEDPRVRLRKLIEQDCERAIQAHETLWWLQRLKCPEQEPIAEQEAFEQFQIQMRASVSARHQTLLDDFATVFSDTALETHGREWMKERWQEERSRWTPTNAIRLEAARCISTILQQERGSSDPQTALAEESTEEREISEAEAYWETETNRAIVADMRFTVQQKIAANRRAWRGAYQSWRRKHLPEETRMHALREAGRRKAELLRDEVRTQVQYVYGLTLPDHFFTFLAFWFGLTEFERQILNERFGMLPNTICRVLETEGVQPERELSVTNLLRARFASDPPEFLPLLSGDSDGLHYGLWYDDPQQPPTGVAYYYTRDEWPPTCQQGENTLLQQIRRHIEEIQEDYQIYSYEMQRELHVELLRDALMAFETAERPETGKDYIQRYGGSQYHTNRPQTRVPTLDQMGVVVPEPIPESLRQRDLEIIATAIAHDTPELQDWYGRALQASNAGDPAEAIALGRDLLWIGHQPSQLKQAYVLLNAGYRALGRPAFAEIARLHYEHWVHDHSEE